MFLQEGTCCLARRNSTSWRPPAISFTIHLSFQAEGIPVLKYSGIQLRQAKVMCFSGWLWPIIGQGRIWGPNPSPQAHDDTNEQIWLWALFWPGRDLVSLQQPWRLSLPNPGYFPSILLPINLSHSSHSQANQPQHFPKTNICINRY